MLPKITDTNPEAEKIQVLLIRKTSLAKRISYIRWNLNLQLLKRLIGRSEFNLDYPDATILRYFKIEGDSWV